MRTVLVCEVIPSFTMPVTMPSSLPLTWTVKEETILPRLLLVFGDVSKNSEVSTRDPDVELVIQRVANE